MAAPPRVQSRSGRRSRPASRAGGALAGGGDGSDALEASAAWHREEVRRARSGGGAGRTGRSTSNVLRSWLPADTLALCGAEQPLFLALDKLDDMVQRVRSEGQDAQKSVLKRLEASLKVCGRT